MIERIYMICLALLLAVGCSENQDIELGDSGEQELVECVLKFNAVELSGDVQSRAIAGTINDVWIIQFDENGGQIGDFRYLTNSDFTDGTTSLELVNSKGEIHTIVCIGNTDDSDLLSNGTFYNGMTLDALKRTQSDFSFSDEAHIVRSCAVEQAIDPSKLSIDCNLEYNIAKINFSVTVKEDVPLKIKSYQMCNVMSNRFYLANYDYEGSEFPTGELAYCTNLAEKTTATTYYIPVNRRAAKGISPSEMSKPLYADDKATYMLVRATNPNTHEEYEYRFYLGADLVSDFNIDPNTHYTYNVTLDDIGDPSTDARITKVTEANIIDYTTRESSNCYIINPTTEALTIYIPVTPRINEFWSSPEYGNDSKLMLKDEDVWTAEVVWNENAISISDSDTDITIVAKATAPSGKEAMKVSVPANYKDYGNSLIAIRNGGDILWSWHLWVTDYNPDAIAAQSEIEENKYTYTIDNSGDAVHRYGGTKWASGAIYADKFIMDRNIGALKTKYTQDARGVIAYQFGRKDPFKYKKNVTLTRVQADAGVSFAESVKKPNTFFYVSNSSYGDWCNDPAAKTSAYIWRDANVKSTGYTTGKSIFDPSPLGWRVPVSGTWSDFTGSNDPTAGTFPYNKPDGDYVTSNEETGRLYRKSVFYPSTLGYIGYSGSAGLSTSSQIWSANMSQTNSAIHFLFNGSNVYSSNTWVPANGFWVRCVQE